MRRGRGKKKKRKKKYKGGGKGENKKITKAGVKMEISGLKR